jgi:hypothetical protein
MYHMQGFNYRTQKNGETIEAEPQPDDIAPQTEPQAADIPEPDIDIVLKETESGQFTFDFVS